MKTGLVLGGGGARGSYQLGVIKALYEAGLIDVLDYCSGTSIGAINTGLLLMGMSMREMINVWKAMDNKKIFDIKNLRIDDDSEGVYSLKKIFESMTGIITDTHINNIKTSPIQGFITTLQLSEQAFLDQLSPKCLRKVSINLNTSLTPLDYMLCSSSIPYFFGPYELNGNRYVDGGMLDNLPIEPIVNFCDVIMCVPLFFKSFSHKYKVYKNTFKTFIDFTPRFLFNEMMAGIEIVNFNKKDLTYRMIYGYELAKALINQLRKNEYLDYKNSFKIKDCYDYIRLDKKEEKDIVIRIREHFKHR